MKNFKTDRRNIPVTDAERVSELAQRSQTLQLLRSVQPVAGVRAPRLDEPGALDVAEHAG